VLGLGGVGGGDAEVCDVVALFQRRNSVDVEDDGGDRSTGFGDDFADVVGDGAKASFRRRTYVPRLTRGYQMPGPSARTSTNFFDPHRIFDVARFARKHFQGAHGAESAIDEESDVVGLDGAGVPSFDDDGRACRGRRQVLSR